MAQHTYANGNNAMHQPDDVIAMLTADRRQVRALFQQYEDAPDPYLKQIMAEHVFAERTLHMLLEAMVFYAAFAEQTDEEGKQLVSATLPEDFILPLFVPCIGRNGSMMCGRYDDIEATGLDFIFEVSHIEGEAFLVPIHMLVVDQRGEAAHVRCDGEGTQDTP